MASKYLKKYHVPNGFDKILHEFIREVLRYQPDDLVDFGAVYFDTKAKNSDEWADNN